MAWRFYDLSAAGIAPDFSGNDIRRTLRESPASTPVPLLLGGRHLRPRMKLPKVGEHNGMVGRKEKGGKD